MADSNLPAEGDSHYSSENNQRMYKGMMDFGFVWGLPLGGAITIFVALLLMGVGVFTTLPITFFTWLGLLGISKSFFVH